jgi:hypothetical protein
MTSPVPSALAAQVAALPDTLVNQQPGALTELPVAYKALKALVPAVNNQAGATTMTGRRITAATVDLAAADNGKIIDSDSATAQTVRIALDQDNNYSTEEYLTEVAQIGAGQVTVAPAVVSSPMMRVLAPDGLKVRAQGLSASVRRVPLVNIPQPALPTTGIRAWWDGDSLTGADGDPIAAWNESQAGLPALTQANAANQPTVYVGQNGRKGAYFAGNAALQFLSFTGAALDLARNKANQMVLIVFATPFSITGDRTMLALSVGNDVARARVLMQQRENAAGNMAVGGRRTDAETTGQYISANAATYPDLSVLGAQFVWSGADLISSKNNVTINTNATFQTAGNTDDTRSAGGCLGANAAGTAQPYYGIVYGVGFWDSSDTVRAAFQSYAEARWGTKWIVGGGVVA